MNELNDETKQDAEACGPGCSCGTSGSGSRWRWMAGVVILLITGTLVARAMVKDNGAKITSTTPAGFAAPPAPSMPTDGTAVADPVTVDTIRALMSLSELNTVAGDTVGVFVFLPGRGESIDRSPMPQVRSAAQMIEPRLRGKVGMFALKTGSRDYEQIALQMTVPGVLAMVKGGGMSAASGDITESKLVQAFVAASSAGGCGSSASGCGPSGCE